MIEIASAQACIGSGGRYELWMHRLMPAMSKSLRLIKAPLMGKPEEIEAELGLPEQPTAEMILQLTDRIATRQRERRIIDPRLLVTASLMRICNRGIHQGRRVGTGVDAERPEAVSRTLVLPGANPPRILLVSPVELAADGVGRVEINRPIGLSLTRPVVSVPITFREHTVGTSSYAVAAGGIDNPEGAVFALVHVGESGWIEQPYVPPRSLAVAA